jgi:cyclase
MAPRHLVAAVLVSLAAACAHAAPGETTITEVAPGVYFRKAQTEPVFTGCNQGFVVFRDYVLVIDANFPGQAENVIASIRERTDKPIRFVFDTHYHGDHADGNMQYVKLGATIVAQERSQPLFQTKGTDGFEGAQKNRAAEYGGLSYEIPSLYFSHKLVFDDGQQRVELVFFGHAHTAGDAVAWMPKHRILFTGDACVNGAFNYTGDANTESWIAVLGAMEDLRPATVCPGHGEAGGPEVIANQKRWFMELRGKVQEAIGRGDSVERVKETLDIPFYKEWTGLEARSRTENIEHVFKELSLPAKPLDEQRRFLRWQGLPGGGGYAGLAPWEAVGQTDPDRRYDALADLFLDADSTRQAQLRHRFRADAAALAAMGTYVRRTAARIRSPEDTLHLRRALAIAAIEGGRGDTATALERLELVRHAALRAGIDADPFLRAIQDHVPPENRPLFDTVRGRSAHDLLATARRAGPPEWRADGVAE